MQLVTQGRTWKQITPTYILCVYGQVQWMKELHSRDDLDGFKDKGGNYEKNKFSV